MAISGDSRVEDKKWRNHSLSRSKNQNGKNMAKSAVVVSVVIGTLGTIPENLG